MTGEFVRVSCVSGSNQLLLALVKDGNRDNPFAELTRNGARMLAKALLAAAEFDGNKGAFGGSGEGIDFNVDARIHGWEWAD